MSLRMTLVSFALVAVGLCNTAAQNNPLLGNWEIVQAQPAPWAEEGQHGALAVAGKRLLNQVITFAPREVISKNKALACKRAEYESITHEPDAIFQGNLPEPNPTAAALRLGFKKSEIPGVDLTKSAKAIGHEIPASLVLRADKVIE